ncbi:class III signal peptide-containing protein [Candidatus Micrarchaeota archaeon]|nr:class III signal peptide-containing protein [Candidatus Micrarchaeota archaeon]
MKGQITLEYMVLSLVVIALLSIAITALITIRDNSDKALDVVLFKSSARDLYNAMEEVCAMGDGNSMEVYLKKDVSVSDAGGYLEFSSPLPHVNGTIKYESFCVLESDADSLSGNVVVYNNEGKIAFG